MGKTWRVQRLARTDLVAVLGPARLVRDLAITKLGSCVSCRPMTNDDPEDW